MKEATVSRKNQIVIPREAREVLGIKAGDKVLVVTRGAVAVMLPKPKSHRMAIRGLARGVYSKEYLQKERQSWD
jgi:AbrB family looped-hinge helix DNA binding protein